MAEKHEITITIAPDGSVQLETRGLVGESCLGETKDLEQALGRVENRAKTSEYYVQRGTVTGSIKRKL
jgi:hypothetical protein